MEPRELENYKREHDLLPVEKRLSAETIKKKLIDGGVKPELLLDGESYHYGEHVSLVFDEDLEKIQNSHKKLKNKLISLPKDDPKRKEVLEILETLNKVNIKEIQISRTFKDLEFEVVDSYGGEGQGETYYKVVYFYKHDIYFRVDGYYTSYDGSSIDGWDSIIEVKPFEKTIIDWKYVR